MFTFYIHIFLYSYFLRLVSAPPDPKYSVQLEAAAVAALDFELVFTDDVEAARVIVNYAGER